MAEQNEGTVARAERLATQADILDHATVPVGAKVPGGTLLAQSSVCYGDGATRPYVVRLVVREQQPHPFVVWVYFLAYGGELTKDRAHGDYCQRLDTALDAYNSKCAGWNVQPNLEGGL